MLQFRYHDIDRKQHRDLFPASIPCFPRWRNQATTSPNALGGSPPPGRKTNLLRYCKTRRRAMGIRDTSPVSGALNLHESSSSQSRDGKKLVRIMIADS